MKISVITIAFNSEQTIEDTIRSVLGQDYPNIEYVIVDGGSKDGTLGIIERYRDKITNVLSEPDRGIYDAMNKGIGLCTGEIIGILNSDDVFASTTVLSQVAKKFEDDVLAVYGDLAYVKRDDLSTITRYWKAGNYKPGSFRKGWMPPHPAFFVRKAVYDQFGRFNLSLKTSADYELMLRFIHKHQIKVAYLPQLITLMRVGGQSNLSLKNRLKANAEDRKAWRINELKPAPFMAIRKPLSKLGQFFRKK